MKNIAHDPDGVSPAVGGYSHGVEVPRGARWLYISGQIPEKFGGEVPGGFEAQCEAAWGNVVEVFAPRAWESGISSK